MTEFFSHDGPAEMLAKFPAITVRCEGETAAVGSSLAAGAYGGLLVLLSGELGAGKTVLARSMGRALGADEVRSPTFVIESTHRLAGRSFNLVHADLYRLRGVSPGSETELRLEEHLSDGSSLLIVEWGDRWLCPPSRDLWKLNISSPDDEEGDVREIKFTASGERAVEGLSAAFGAILDEIARKNND
jgi:tRNA threonylcarbamoyladenosine biosynthesis protein TsaE